MESTKEFKVSVVTAVYNVEAYLEEMIESIIAQSIGFENIQMILVDDGSKDGSGDICDQYASQYPDNIVVIHKENGGVSSARNEGLKHVQGEYVNFTDADDMLEENALEVMYDYLKENEEWIDLVAIRLKFFGAKEGNHPLNYKFGKTRIVDLRKEYNCIQMSMSCALIRVECFKNRHFDMNLSYAEDAQLIVDILIDKMSYGVISETSYLYRKRNTGGSAIDSGRKKTSYYIPYMQSFILHSIENAIQKKGYLPLFVQYTCMYDLQWRLNQNPLIVPGVLTDDEKQEYKSLLIKAVQYIDDKIIMEQKNIGNNYKIAILLLKEENQKNKELISFPDDLKICIKDISSAGISSYSMFFEFIDISTEYIIIEGYVRYFSEVDNIEIILRSESNNSIEFKAKLFNRIEKYNICMDKIITKAKGFQFSISRAHIPDYMNLQLCIRYQSDIIVCKNIIFGKFFPLSKQLKNSYFYQDNILLTYHENSLELTKITKRKIIRKYENSFQKELLASKNKMIYRGWIARNIYHILKFFKKRELWLISDRLTKADDNGEAFFTYMNAEKKNSNINTYFVLDKKSKDYKRLHKIGKVVDFHSTKHKILSLLCDKVVSAQADDYVFNRFFNLSYLYKDILHHQKFIFLQHGIIKDDLSRWLAKSNKNIRIFITTTHMEYKSILDNAYYYDEKQVKCTGLPRYDYLYDDTNTKRIITFMPTWRSYLAGDFDVDIDSRILKDGFENSSYCQMYQQIFADKRLYKSAAQYHYELQLMMHPSMPVECIKHFGCPNTIKVLDRNTQYKELFANSKLIITDYSSTVFDFAYLRKPVIYYQQDVDEFFSGNHTYDKGYFDYERDGFGEVEYTADALVSRIIEYMENDCKLKDVYRNRIEKTFIYNDKNNCKRVYDEIIKL